MTRVLQGYDCHVLKVNNSASGIKVCGMSVPCKYDVVANSDGDVVYHAIIDALSACFLHKTIGELFPTTCIKTLGKDSSVYLKSTYEKCGKPQIEYIDIIIIADHPALLAFIEEMKDNLTTLLNIDKKNIAIKPKHREDGTLKISALCLMGIENSSCNH